jgi:DNA polymerase-3 subunit chi
MAAAQVEFHTGVPDTQAFACRLLRKAYRAGATVLCLLPPDRLNALDRALWSFVERDFVPHAPFAGTPAGVLRRTPIWLASAWPSEATDLSDPTERAARDVVLNLGGDLPVAAVSAAVATRGLRVIEVVGLDAEEVERGRALWRQYKAAGFEVVHHTFTAREGARED